MKRSVWERVRKILAEALDLPPESRGEFLSLACGADAELRNEVLALLDDNIAGDLLLPSAPWLRLLEPSTHPLPAMEKIGPYDVVRELGRGGMGVVYLAVRGDAEFDQTVAIKVLKKGLDTDEILRRFRRERQILASLVHENISRLYDGGSTEDGRPYFAMEYVKGQALDRHCDDERLDITDRIGLFQKICEAVQFAHAKLVVHRDIKPGNIIVTADGTPKLLDFGVCKMLSDGGGEDTAITARELQILTPQYASPEQLLGKPVTVASDVYSLGLVLYELLCGRQPYRLKFFHPEAVRKALNHPPPPPSQTVASELQPPRGETTTQVGHPPSVSDFRRTTPSKLRRRLRGDLDRIVLKALESNPANRYASVERLSDDLQRHLDGLPVLASGRGRLYVAWKLLRRHKLALGSTAAIVLLSLAFGLMMATLQQRAAKERDTARHVSDFLVDIFEISDPGESKGATITAREILDYGSQRIQEDLKDEPEIRATLLHTLGRVYRNLGIYSEARSLLQKGLDLRTDLFGAEHLKVSESLNEIGELALSSDFNQAEAHFRRALALRLANLPEKSSPVVESLNNLGWVLHLQGKDAEAEPMLRKAAAIQSGLPSKEPAVINSLAWVVWSTGRPEEALRLFEEAQTIRIELFGQNHPRVATGWLNLAAILEEMQDKKNAERLLRKALELFRTIYGEAHSKYGTALHNLGNFLRRNGDPEEAERLLRESLEIARKQTAPNHPDIGVTLGNLARLLTDRGDYQAAMPLYLESQEILRSSLGENHPYVAYSLVDLAGLYFKSGQSSKVAPLYKKALDILQQAPPDHVPTATIRINQAEWLESQGDHADCLDAVRTALATLRRSLGPDHSTTRKAERLEAQCLIGLGRFDEAEAILEDAIAKLSSPADSPMKNTFLTLLEEIYEKTRKPEEAARNSVSFKK